MHSLLHLQAPLLQLLLLLLLLLLLFPVYAQGLLFVKLAHPDILNLHQHALGLGF